MKNQYSKREIAYEEKLRGRIPAWKTTAKYKEIRGELRRNALLQTCRLSRKEKRTPTRDTSGWEGRIRPCLQTNLPVGQGSMLPG